MCTTAWPWASQQQKQDSRWWGVGAEKEGEEEGERERRGEGERVDSLEEASKTLVYAWQLLFLSPETY